MFTKASLVALFASLAAAQRHAPVGDKPTGNSITRPLNEVVPACKPFTITWQPSSPNTVSVLLLKGPSSNVVKFGPSLAEGIPNSGSLVWTPASTLDATSGPTGYGIQIIDDVTGFYQYSTQFGISKDGCPVSSAAPAASSAAAGYPVASIASSSKSKEGYPVASSVLASASASKPVISSAVPYPTQAASALVASSGLPYNNSIIQPTGVLTVPSSLRPTATGSASTSHLPEASGAASSLQAGLSVAGAAVAFAFML